MPRAQQFKARTPTPRPANDRAALGVAYTGPREQLLCGRLVICDHLTASYAIYGLVDPAEPHRVRYVGRGRNPYARYKEHMTGGAQTTPTISRWVEGLCNQGRMPAMVLLEGCAIGDEEDLERHWIDTLRAQGQADLNGGIVRPRALPS